MAQLVGDAYVRIFADTHALRRAIDRDVKRIGKDIGDGLGESVLTNFGKTIERRADLRLRRYQITLADAIAGGDFNQMLRRSGRGIDEFVAGIRKDLEQFEERGYFKKVAGNAYDFRQALETLDTWAEKTKVADEMRRIERASADMALKVEAQNRAWATYGRNLLAAEKRLGDTDIRLRRYSNTLNRTVILLRRHGDATGRMFGAGSRSELLNFIGRLMGGLSQIPTLAFRAFSRVFEGVTGVVEQFKALQEEGVGVFAAIRTIGTGMLTKLVPSLIAAVAGIAAMTQLLPVLILFFGHLAGAAAAVAGAIGIGLAGALLAVAPLLPAIIAGFGGIALAIAGVADRGDELKRRLRPVIDAFDDLKEVLGDELFKVLTRNANNFAAVIREWTPMFREVVRVLGFVTDRFVGLLRHPAMKPFMDAWQTSIPNILRSLGDGFGALTGALIAFFRPILPFAERLADAFADAMSVFLEWTTSARGQNSIADFMEKAWGFGKQLWSILGNIGDALGSILSAGAEGPGKDFLTWLDRVTAKFAEWLDTPEGQAALKQFFIDVKETMVGIRDLITVFVDKLGDVNWEQASKDLQTIIDGATMASRVIAGLFDAIGMATTSFRLGFGLTENPFADFPKWAEFTVALTAAKFTWLWETIISALETFGATINSTLDFVFGEIPGIIATKLLPVSPTLLAAFVNPLPLLAGALSAIVGQVGSFIGRIPGVIGVHLAGVGARIVAPFTNAIPVLIGVIGGMVARIREAIGRIPGVIAAGLVTVGINFLGPFTRVIPGISGLLSRITGAVRSGVSAIPSLVSIGLLSLVNRFTAPFANAYSAILGWIRTIKDAILGAVSWMASIDLNPFSSPGPAGPRGGFGGPGFGGPGPRGGGGGGGMMAAAPDPFGMSRFADALGDLTSPIRPVQQQSSGPVFNFFEGAIKVTSPATDPSIVATQVIDRIAAAVN